MDSKGINKLVTDEESLQVELEVLRCAVELANKHCLEGNTDKEEDLVRFSSSVRNLIRYRHLKDRYPL